MFIKNIIGRFQQNFSTQIPASCFHPPHIHFIRKLNKILQWRPIVQVNIPCLNHVTDCKITWTLLLYNIIQDNNISPARFQHGQGHKMTLL